MSFRGDARAHRRGHFRLGGAALIGIGLAAMSTMAVGSGASARAVPAATQSAGEKAWNALLATAKASNHIVSAPLSQFGAPEIAADEAGFQKAFGFPVNIQVVPGHPALVVPGEIVAAGPSGKGVVDWIYGSLNYSLGVLNATPPPGCSTCAGYIRKPDWAALDYEWPHMSIYSSLVEPQLTRKVGKKTVSIRDYSALSGQLPYVIVYNTKYVTASQMQNATWDTLTDPTYKGHIAMELSGTLPAYYGLGMGRAAMISYVDKLVANSETPTSGGSAGVVNAVASGQDWIGIATYSAVATGIQKGEPIGYAIPPFTSKTKKLAITDTVSYLLDPGVNNSAMAEVYWAWWINQGLRETSQFGELRLDPQERTYFPLAKTLATDGYTPADFTLPTNLQRVNLFNSYVAQTGKLLTGS